jgi:hypothetical protein
MAPALPAEQARLLLAEVERLLAREARVGELLVELRQVFPELRRLLNELASSYEAGAPTTPPSPAATAGPA